MFRSALSSGRICCRGVGIYHKNIIRHPGCVCVWLLRSSNAAAAHLWRMSALQPAKPTIDVFPSMVSIYSVAETIWQIVNIKLDLIPT